MEKKKFDPVRFLFYDLWQMELAKASRSKSFIVRFLRVVILSFRGFVEDNCALRASALTFYSILSLVPFVALIISVAKGFGLQKFLEQRIAQDFSEQQMVVGKIMTFAEKLLQNTKSSATLASIGILILLWTTIKLMTNIEMSFNHIWGVKSPRSVFRRITDYLSFVLICPIVMIVAGSATVFLTHQINDVLGGMAFLSPAAVMIAKFAPLVMFWLLFCFIYMFMPNTKVDSKSAVVAGLIGGTAFQFLLQSWVVLQVTLSSYNTVYGSLSALPLFLVWLQLSWLVVLFGAEVAFATQNAQTYEFETSSAQLCERRRRLFALWVMTVLTRRFIAGQGAMDDEAIAHKCSLPIRLTREIIEKLYEGNLICRVVVDEKHMQTAWQLSVSPEDLSVEKVLATLDSRGSSDFPLPPDKEFETIAAAYEQILECCRQSKGNLLLKKI